MSRYQELNEALSAIYQAIEEPIAAVLIRKSDAPAARLEQLADFGLKTAHEKWDRILDASRFCGGSPRDQWWNVRMAARGYAAESALAQHLYDEVPSYLNSAGELLSREVLKLGHALEKEPLRDKFETRVMIDSVAAASDGDMKKGIDAAVREVLEKRGLGVGTVSRAASFTEKVARKASNSTNDLIR